MARLDITIEHGQPPKVAKAKFKAAIHEVQTRFRDWFERIEWTDDDESATFTGSGVQVTLLVRRTLRPCPGFDPALGQAAGRGHPKPNRPRHPSPVARARPPWLGVDVVDRTRRRRWKELPFRGFSRSLACNATRCTSASSARVIGGQSESTKVFQSRKLLRSDDSPHNRCFWWSSISVQSSFSSSSSRSWMSVGSEFPGLSPMCVQNSLKAHRITDGPLVITVIVTLPAVPAVASVGNRLPVLSIGDEARLVDPAAVDVRGR